MIKKKTKIVIASVLKPVDDVRNYEKLGRTLANENYQVVIMGIQGHQKTGTSGIVFHPWPNFRRLSFGRLLVQIAYIRALVQYKPDLVLVTTHELLLASVCLKLLLRFKLIYDVQEDYFKNLKYQVFYPVVVRFTAAFLIRSVEWVSRPFINEYLLAEKVYASDIKFVKGKFAVVDNKSLPIGNTPPKDYFHFIFTGTITEYSKALEAIELYLKIKNGFPNPRLTVIGYCPSKTYFGKLSQMVHVDSSIQLLIHDSPVPHSQIVEQIEKANLGIISYEPNPINEYKIPTKQYEYTVARLPYLVRQDSYWSELGDEFGNAIAIDFKTPDVNEILSKVEKINRSQINMEGALWQNNESALIHSIDKLFVLKK